MHNFISLVRCAYKLHPFRVTNLAYDSITRVKSAHIKLQLLNEPHIMVINLVINI